MMRPDPTLRRDGRVQIEHVRDGVVRVLGDDPVRFRAVVEYLTQQGERGEVRMVDAATGRPFIRHPLDPAAADD